MSRLHVCAVLVVGALTLTSDAFGNGRDPATSTINFMPGMEEHIVAGMTFGAVRSQDGGATWTWQCEDAIGYGGEYDPDYQFTAPAVVEGNLRLGALFATTFDGLKVNRDGCVYTPAALGPAPPAITFISKVAYAPDPSGPGRVYAAAAVDDGNLYVSTDNGMTFTVLSMPGQAGDWWQSVEVAPSDPAVLYLTGYRLELGMPKQFLIRRSSDGGQTFTSLPVDDLAAMTNSTIEIAGISSTDANLLYARVELADNVSTHVLYRSRDGGQNWEPVLEKTTAIAFVVRKSGQLVAGTKTAGAFVSDDEGDTWTALPNAPHINCLVENAAEEVWACTQNYGTPEIPSDGFGIMKTTDLATWTGVLRYQDIAAPDPCPDGTVQKDKCDATLWCGICGQLGCNPNRDCAIADAGPSTDGGSGSSKGCCQSHSSASVVPGMMMVMIIGIMVLRKGGVRSPQRRGGIRND